MNKLWKAAAALFAAVWIGVPAPVFAAEGGTETAVTKETARAVASGLVPEDSEFQYAEQCGDAFEVLYYSDADKAYYTVRVSVFTGEVTSVSSALVDCRGSREAVLTEDQVTAIASEDAGEVDVESVALDTVAGRKKYEVLCSGDGFAVSYQINAEIGKILKKTVQYH